jgi:hypothetical protein
MLLSVGVYRCCLSRGQVSLPRAQPHGYALALFEDRL